DGVLSVEKLAAIYQRALFGSGWSTEQVVEILRGLELCDWVDGEKREVLIPALLEGSREALHGWSNYRTEQPVLGRRLSCGPDAGTVLPAGVFTLLQVRLRKRFRVRGDSEFVTDGVSVSFLVDGAALLVHFDPARARQLSIVAKVRDVRRQLVDGLDRVEEICREVYQICAEKGVLNEHCVKEEVKLRRSKGLSGWEAEAGRCLRYSELLTTAELEGVVGELTGARQDELPDADAPEFEGDRGLRELIVRTGGTVVEAGRQGERRILAAGQRRHEELMAAIEDLRKGQGVLLKQVEQQGRFLRTQASLPRFMYVADERGLFTRLWDVLSRTATLHLLCEGGRMPHVVADQPGKTFQATREWAKTAGPYLQYSLRVLIVVAKIAASAAAPGVDRLIPDVATGLFSSAEGEKLRQILGKAVGTTLAKEVATFADDVGKWTDAELGRGAGADGLGGAVQDSLLFLLEKVGAAAESVLNDSFKLWKVEVRRAYAGKEPGQVIWVCENCKKDLGAKQFASWQLRLTGALGNALWNEAYGPHERRFCGADRGRASFGKKRTWMGRTGPWEWGDQRPRWRLRAGRLAGGATAHKRTCSSGGVPGLDGGSKLRGLTARDGPRRIRLAEGKKETSALGAGDELGCRGRDSARVDAFGANGSLS
ncbi:hypothetical protein KFL_013930010, partial [Klebsormidium nitens]